MVYSNLYSFSDLLTIFPFGKTKLRQLLLAGVHDSPQGFVRFCGAAHIAESLLLVDRLQRQGQHFGAALMMPLTASLIFRAT